MLELITILSLITLSLSWIQDYLDLIINATDDRLSESDQNCLYQIYQIYYGQADQFGQTPPSFVRVLYPVGINRSTKTVTRSNA